MRALNKLFIYGAIALIVIGFIVMVVIPGVFGYLFYVVHSDEIGVVEQYGEVVDFVGPGTYVFALPAPTPEGD